jgi:tetratricopeptide (TPR) repeat protein
LSFNVFADDNKDPQSNVKWWIDNHNVVDKKLNPLVEKAEKVFERVLASADKRSNLFPRLVVIKGRGEPWALAIPDGTVILTEGALNLCYKDVTPEQGNDRLALILGHELAHLAKDDYRHGKMTEAFKSFAPNKLTEALELLKNLTDANKDDPNYKESRKLKEIESDSYAIIYMTMAGYNPKTIVNDKGTNFIKEFVSQTGYDKTIHPDPQERAASLQANMENVAKDLQLFRFGVFQYHLGNYEESKQLFDMFKTKFPGREVFNNIGLCQYQLAMKTLNACNEALPLRFYLSTELDTETLGANLQTRRTTGVATSGCLEKDEYKIYINDSIKYLKQAVEMDPAYIPARINLSSVYIMAGQYSKALAFADETLKIHPDLPSANNNRAIALYLYGLSSNIDMVDNALNILNGIVSKNPSYGRAVFNIARIQSERGREAGASENWNAFLKIETTGLYACAVKRALEILDNKDAQCTEKSANLKSAYPFGEIQQQTAEQLKQMKKLKYTLGDTDYEIYEDDKNTILVIDNYIEIVLTKSNIDVNKFKEEQGEPSKIQKTIYGETLFYKNIIVDVKDNKVREIAFFKEREG